MKNFSESTGLYFIAWVPKGDLLEELWRKKREIAEKYSVRQALKSPPHVTLHMPFNWRMDREDRLIAKLSKVSFEQFPIQLIGYDSFPPKVLYITVLKTPEIASLYEGIQAEMRTLLHRANASYKDRGFTPHLTLAFRDLNKKTFISLWEDYRHQEYAMEQVLNSFQLLKHDGSQWQVHHSFN